MNKFLFSVLKDSVLRSPFVPAKKHDGAAWQAAGNVVGSILGFFGNERTNANNLQIARETNEQNKQLFHEQLDYQTGMWNKANEYNDPKNQSKRLAAAGINPAAVLGNGSAVSDVSSPSSPAAPEMIAPTMQNYDVGASLQQGLNSYINAKNVNAQTRLLDEQASKEHFENEIAFARWEYEQKERSQELARKIQEYEFEKEKHPHDIKHLQGMIDLLSSQKEEIDYDLYEKRVSFDERQRGLRLGNDLVEEKIDSEKVHRDYEMALSNKALADAHLSRATAKRILTLLPDELRLTHANAVSSSYEAGNYVVHGFRTRTEMQDYAESVARIASMQVHDDIDLSNFKNWYTRYVVPSLGAAAPIITALVFKKIKLPKK